MAKQTAKAATKPTPAKTAAVAVPTGSPLALFNQTPLVPIRETGASSPYVVFFQTNATQAGNMIAALRKLDDSQPVLVNGSTYTKLTPFEFILVPNYKEYFAELDQNNDIVKAAPGNVDVIPMQSDGKKKFVQCIDAVILIVLQSEIAVARCSFRGAKVPACKTAVNELIALTDDVQQWAGRSKDHEALSKTQFPQFAWVTVETTLTTRQPRSRANGEKDYQELTGVPKPTGLGALKMLAEANANPEWQNTFNACVKDHESRFAEIEKKFVG